jgi:hypothetical protein
MQCDPVVWLVPVWVVCVYLLCWDSGARFGAAEATDGTKRGQSRARIYLFPTGPATLSKPSRRIRYVGTICSMFVVVVLVVLVVVLVVDDLLMGIPFLMTLVLLLLLLLLLCCYCVATVVGTFHGLWSIILDGTDFCIVEVVHRRSSSSSEGSRPRHTTTTS